MVQVYRYGRESALSALNETTTETSTHPRPLYSYAERKTPAHTVDGSEVSNERNEYDEPSADLESTETDVVPDPDPKHSVARSTAIMSAATLTSRVTGFIRTWAIGFALGNTLLTSSYQLANNIPNMIYELIAGGILSTAFLPVYLEQTAKYGRERGWKYASTLINLAIVVLGAIAVLATIFAPQVIATQTFRTPAEDAQLAVFFFRFFAIQIVFYGVSGVVSGLLNANREFLWPAAGPIFNNIVVIITLFGFVPLSKTDPEFAKAWLAVGTTLGVIAMGAVQIPSLLKIGMRYVPKIDLKDPGLRATMRLVVPAVIFTITNLVAVSVRNAYAFEVAPNGPSTLSFAWMWYQFPYGVMAVALSTAIFTELSDAAGRGLWTEFKQRFARGLRATLFLIIPMAVMLVVLARPLVMLFKFGRFTAQDVEVVSGVLSWWGVALPFFAAYMYTYFAFSAFKDLKTVTTVKIGMTVIQVALYALLTVGFGTWKGIGLIGVPVSDLVFYTLMFLVLVVILRKKIGAFDLSGVVSVTARIALAAVAGGAVAFALLTLLNDGGQTVSSAFGALMVCGIAGLATTWGLCAALHVSEMSFLFGVGRRIARVFKRSRA